MNISIIAAGATITLLLIFGWYSYKGEVINPIPNIADFPFYQPVSRQRSLGSKTGDSSMWTEAARRTAIATNQGSYAELKTSTVYGLSTAGATGTDITRTAGTIVLNATDLVNATANGQGFSVKTEPTNVFYGVVDNIGNATHYLLPGATPYPSLSNAVCGIPFAQKVIVFELTCSAASALTGAEQAIFNLYKNVVGTPIATATLDSSNQIVRVTNFSQTITTTDKLVCELVTAGSIGNIPLTAAVSIY